MIVWGSPRTAVLVPVLVLWERRIRAGAAPKGMPAGD